MTRWLEFDWRLFALLGITACGFPRPADIVGDVPPDASQPACFGAAPFSVCLPEAPSRAIQISEPTTIDTTISDLCVRTMSESSSYCVIAGTTITIDGTLRGTGSKALVLIASDSIIIHGQIDVASHRSNVEFVGAGADPDVCTVGILPGPGAGGAGGSFAGAGGRGGDGGAGTGIGGQPGRVIQSVSEVRGGCPGQRGNGDANGGGGHGGGAVYLIAGNRIEITGNVELGAGIHATGEGGQGGGPGGNGPSGAGGGGSGGMIGLDAPVIECGAFLLASGGGGGEGGSQTSGGAPGMDPITQDAAFGGAATLGGTGGRGSLDVISGAGQDGQRPPGSSFGGGGGGGGAGIIIAPSTAVLDLDFVSPPPFDYGR